MVLLTRCLCLCQTTVPPVTILASGKAHVDKQARKALSFVDSLRIRVKAGRGGCGLPRFGGLGGKGGDVFLEGSRGVKDLRELKRSITRDGFIAGR